MFKKYCFVMAMAAIANSSANAENSYRRSWDVPVTLGTTTRCSVANNSSRGIDLTTIAFFYSCDGKKRVSSRSASMHIFRNEVVNLDLTVDPECHTVAPLYCRANWK